jgi:hypothetical protein
VDIIAAVWVLEMEGESVIHSFHLEDVEKSPSPSLSATATKHKRSMLRGTSDEKTHEQMVTFPTFQNQTEPNLTRFKEDARLKKTIQKSGWNVS